MRKHTLYHFSGESLDFRAIRWLRAKLLIAGVIVGAIVFWIAMDYNVQEGDVLGLGLSRNASLLNENRVLKSQLHQLTQRISVLDKSLASIVDRSNEMRLLVDLPKLGEDVEKAGAGGVDERINLTGAKDVNEMLNNVRALTAKAEREIQLQNSSYAEIVKNYEANKVKFAHFPALKPMDGYYSRRGIGIRLHPVLGIYRKHEGLDIVNDVGTPVYASGDGTVYFAGRDGGYGLMVELDHGYSYKTLYGHLSKILVREGQTVKRGQLIARSGNTGLSSGPHLHYEVRLNGIPLNPDEYFFDDVKPAKYAELLKESDSKGE